jgi:exopolysaccharide production protein ExoZ
MGESRPDLAEPSDAPRREYLHSLRLYRAAACLLVVLFHLGGALESPKYFNEPLFLMLFSTNGSAGVNFFFVLTGFTFALISWRDVGNPQRLPSYLGRRFLRIYPLYLVVFFAVWIVQMARHSTEIPTDPALLLKAALLVPLDPDVVGGTGAPVLFVAWSLQYFILLYLVFGLLILNRTAGIIVIGSLASWLFASWALDSGYPFGFLKIWPFALCGAGMFVGFAVRARWCEQHARTALTLGAIAFVATVACIKARIFFPDAVAGWDINLRPAAFGAVACLLLFGLVTLERQGWRPQWRAGLVLGDASYALYLLHVPVMGVVLKLAVAAGLAGLASAWLSWSTALVVCIASALFVHRWIGEPLIAAARRLPELARLAAPAARAKQA